jgi:predicted ATPase
MNTIKKFLIAVILSLSLIAPSFATENTLKKSVVNEESVNDLAKQLAGILYLLESLSKEIKKGLENFGKEIDKELERKRKKESWVVK